jgi:hypothetical protein
MITMRRLLPVVLLLPLVAATFACAGSTVGAGVAPKLLRRAPWYAGNETIAAGRIVHLPIVAGEVRGAGGDAAEAEAGSPAATLLGQLNAYLDSLAVSRPLAPGSRAPRATPDVSFGCETQGFDECVDAEANQGNMMLEVTRASDEWAAWLAGELDRAGGDALLVITLELADYWPRSRGLTATKEVELGTGYTQSLPWLTAMDRPVQVLQLTGALVGPDGKAIRIGAEGLLAKRTRLLLGAFGVREMLSDEDVARLATLTRDDLPGKPLAWQVALRSLVERLAGRASIP